MFHDHPKTGAFNYFDATPYLVVKTAVDCTFTTEVLTISGAEKSVGLKTGFGSAKLSIKVTNGVISDIGQDTDTEVPQS